MVMRVRSSKKRVQHQSRHPQGSMHLQSPFRTFVAERPLAVSIGAAILVLIFAWFAPPAWLNVVVGLLACVLLGVAIELLRRTDRSDGQGETVQLLLSLARDDEISDLHRELAQSLLAISERRDPIYRQSALEQLEELAEGLCMLGEGRIEFMTTESWRLAYEELLRSPGLYQYRSVAHVETPHYWQDGPGQLSTRLNLELQAAGTLIVERTVILADHLWREDTLFPVDPIHAWIDEQCRHGIALRVVRESALATEPEVVSDLGIYGTRAVGRQQLDPSGHTMRFILSFDVDEVCRAEQLWERLNVYAVSYRDLLDQGNRSD